VAKKTIRAEVGDIKYELEGTLESAIKVLQRYSQELGPTACISIGERCDSYSYSDTQYAYVELSIEREETDEEHAERLQKEQAHRLRIEENERKEFARLAAKYKGL
jgi:hypothetical protein